MLETVREMAAELVKMADGSSSGRSRDLPEGSPTRAVAPPTSAVTR